MSLAIVLAASAVFAGCSAPPRRTTACGKYSQDVDDRTMRHFSRNQAKDVLDEMQACSQEPLPRDYREGFKTGYADVATGHSGATPPIAPSQYWNAYYRGPWGAGKAQGWLEGYRAGADSAYQAGVPESRYVQTSPVP